MTINGRCIVELSKNIIVPVNFPQESLVYGVVKEGKSSVVFDDDFTIEYDLRGAALKDKWYV